MAELFSPSGPRWPGQNSSTLVQYSYPVTFLVPGGTAAGGWVVTLARNDSTYWLDIPASGQSGPWQRLNNAYAGLSAEGGVMYRPGRIMLGGGKVFGGAGCWYDQ